MQGETFPLEALSEIPAWMPAWHCLQRRRLLSPSTQQHVGEYSLGLGSLIAQLGHLALPDHRFPCCSLTSVMESILRIK